MKVTAISIILFLFFLMPSASAAIDFTFSSPENVEINESFSVSISATTSDKYDVKIFIEDNTTAAENYLSQIYNGEWKNPRYYLVAAFPDESSFDIRAAAYSDNAQICTRLRKTNSSSTYTKCALITIKEQSYSGGGNEEQKEPEANKSSTSTQTPLPDFVPLADGRDNQPVSNQIEESGRIVLNPKSTASEPFITTDEKLRQWAVYSFTFLTILIIIFLALKKL